MGFALDLFGDGTTSIRGGFGLNYDKIFQNVINNSRFNPPFFSLASLSNVFFGDDLSGFPLLGDDPEDLSGGFLGVKVFEPQGFDDFGAPIGLTTNLRIIDPSIRDTYVHNLFLGLQRELPWETVFEFNFQATYGKKLGFVGDPNRFSGDLLGWANPLGEHAEPGCIPGGLPSRGGCNLDLIHGSFSYFNLRQNRVTSNYHGLNLQVQKRMSQGLAFQTAYTFGKSLDLNSDVFGGGFNYGGSSIGFADPTNIGLDYGRSNFDIRHRWVTNLLWELPLMRDQQGVLGKIIGGWQLTGVFATQTGLPFTVRNSASFRGVDPETGAALGGDPNADGWGNERPNQPSFGNRFPSQPSTSEYIAGALDRDDFSNPQAGFNGNLGKNTFEGPNFWSMEFGLFKNFQLPFSEESRLQFRAEFFNLFNRVNLYLPTINMDNSFFGRSTQQFSPREIQLALKLVF